MKPKTLVRAVDSAARHQRVFISYSHGGPDERLAAAVASYLQNEHDVYIDKRNLIGEDWGLRIDKELRAADVLIVFLSQQSVRSEMVLGEVRKAHRLSKENAGRPRILPIRVKYRAEFDYPLNAILDPKQWGYWESDPDTGPLIDQIRESLRGEPFVHGSSEPPIPQPAMEVDRIAPRPVAQIDNPGGTMPADSRFYVRRNSDTLALSEIEHEGVTLSIKGARQRGKSSLLVQVLGRAQALRKRAVFLDFQLVDRTTLQDADRFYRWFSISISDSLGLQNSVKDYWLDGLTNLQRCTRYVEQYVLNTIEGLHLVISLDEVDRLFDSAFSSDFFGMLRSWHNTRARQASWRRVDLILVTSTEPYLLIDNNQSPFNVGLQLEVGSFTIGQISDLNLRHGSPLREEECTALQLLLGGHPYLTRRALYLISTQQYAIKELFKTAADERGAFGDHLRYYTSLLSGRTQLIDGLKEVLRSQTCTDASVRRRLEGAGIVRPDGLRVVPSCKMYESYFARLLHA